MVEIIKDNLMTIVMFGLTFLVGIGIGAGITDTPEQMDPEEVTNILYVLRLGASNREKRVIDYLIDREEREKTNEE